MNHKFLLATAIVFFVARSMAQTASGYVPFHQVVLQHHGDIQHNHGNARAVTFKEIGYSHNTYNQGGGSWSYADSGVFNYNQNAYEVWETNGSFYTFNDSTLTWPITSRIVNSVNGLDQIDTMLGQVTPALSSPTVWTNSYIYTFSFYPSNNYLNTETFATWFNGAWVDSVQYIYTYNANNYDSTLVVQKWRNGGWQNDTQYIYSHSGYLNIQTITQTWSGSAWVNLYNKYVSSFDPNNNPAQSQIYQWNGSTWVPYQQEITAYDGFGGLNNFTLQIWSPAANGGLGAYVNYYSEVYEYVLGNNTQFNSYQWDTTTFPQTKTNLLQYNYSYDANHNVIYEVDQTFTAGVTQNTDQYFYTYNVFYVNGIEPLKNSLQISVSPNPSTIGDNAFLNLTSDQSSDFSIQLFDAVGRELNRTQISSVQGQNMVPLNLTGFATGCYFVKVRDNSGKSSVIKVVKQ